MNTRWSSRLSHFICGCFSVCLQQWQMQFVLSVSFERCIRQNAPHTQLCLVNLVFSQLIVSQLDGSSKKGKFARVSLACSSAPQLPRKHRRRSAPQHGSRLSLSASSKTHRSVGPMLLIVGEAAQLCSRQVSPFFSVSSPTFPSRAEFNTQQWGRAAPWTSPSSPGHFRDRPQSPSRGVWGRGALVQRAQNSEQDI